MIFSFSVDGVFRRVSFSSGYGVSFLLIICSLDYNQNFKLVNCIGNYNICMYYIGCISEKRIIIQGNFCIFLLRLMFNFQLILILVIHKAFRFRIFILNIILRLDFISKFPNSFYSVENLFKFINSNLTTGAVCGRNGTRVKEYFSITTIEQIIELWIKDYQQKISDEPTSKVYTLMTHRNSTQIVRAIKFQDQNVQFPQISKQVAMLKKIFARNEFEIGFPRLYEFGSMKSHNYMITTLLGPNLAQLHKLCNNRFSISTCLLVGLQILDRLEKIHQIGFVYRDIRLENFVIGMGNQSPFIYMIDFGHCERYKDSETNRHMTYKEGNANLEDTNFTSVNVHNNVRYTRRDDIESLLYLIIYMHKAKLPWKKVQAKTKKEKDEKIGQIKKAVTPSYLSYNFGLQMADLFWYIRSVNFYEKPDYEFIRGKLYAMILQKSQNKSQIQIKYDWNEREEMDYMIYNGDPKLHLNKSDSPFQEVIKQHKQSIDDGLDDDEDDSLLQ